MPITEYCGNNILRTTTTKIIMFNWLIYQSESAAIKAMELHEYTHKERRFFIVWLDSDVTKRHIGDNPTHGDAINRRNSGDAISTIQLSRFELHTGLQCFCIHSCYRPFLCLALESFTCDASRHSQQREVLWQQHLTYHKPKNYHV